MVYKHIKKLVVLACTLATMGTANAWWWSNTWNNYTYGTNDSWSENWVSDGYQSTWQDVTNWGQISQCNWGGGSCQVNHTESVWTTWSEATTIGTKVAVPNFWELSVTQSFTYGKTQTTADSLIQNISPGQKAQFYVYVPRRFGWTTFRGYCYYNYQQRNVMIGRTFSQPQWGYEWDGWGTVAQVNGYKAQSSPVWGYRITSI